ncbi:MAG: DEAD/DEAH box helicase, partial [Fervidicoccus fontis]
MRKSDLEEVLRPYTLEWFRWSFGDFTEPQKRAIPLIKRGENVLISSPTGTGKTLAAFLGIIDALYALSEEKKLENEIYVLYVSPLRAL